MTPAGGSGTGPVLDVRGLVVSYGAGPAATRRPVVRGVDLAVRSGEVVALVGESGSGKSSTIRGALGLVPVDAGEAWIGDVDLLAASRRERQRLRARVQLVFQDPYSSLDPLMSVADLVAEPLRVHTGLSRPERIERVAGMLERVGIGRDALRRLPADFSGGQRQRIAIARALVVGPQVLVCDEPVSALDVSTQNQVLALIRSTCDRDGVGVLLVAHDLAVVRQVADRVAVMYRGEIVEERSCDELFDAPPPPLHPRAARRRAPDRRSPCPPSVRPRCWSPGSAIPSARAGTTATCGCPTSTTARSGASTRASVELVRWTLPVAVSDERSRPRCRCRCKH